MIFFRKKIELTPQDWGLRLDMHNHILPGIDDGAANETETSYLRQGLHQLGFTHTIPSPHIASGLYLNTRGSITNAMAQLKNDTINSVLVPAFAAEYMLDDYFRKLLAENLITYPTTSQRYVLVEFPYLGLPPDWHELIFDLRKQGYQPILAHPERYSFLSVEQLSGTIANAGCLFQLNLLSLSGYYGKEAMVKAKYLMQAQLYSFAGTDMHHANHLDALLKMKNDADLSAIIAAYPFKNDSLI
jgi:tyrosine-protein phosphatase YwqE